MRKIRVSDKFIEELETRDFFRSIFVLDFKNIYNALAPPKWLRVSVARRFPSFMAEGMFL